MKLRPSLLMLMAAAAGASVLANGVSAADPAPAAPETRLGASIKQDFAKRDQEAARRARALELREQAARAAEQRLQAGGAMPQQRAGGTEMRDPNEERFSELARIYQAMKPARAAVVLEQLEMDVQVEVARRMRERSTGQILAAMSPQRAAALTMAMARMPQPQPILASGAGQRSKP
ncbi:MotE family protein [Novosphingobium sp. M1R2S20]|uniref:MotE family protein n=1 Tax=Novosphingobium rhizovicinum TaxID=3228928 RepID=A0ABV3R8S7_9SPHN